MEAKLCCASVTFYTLTLLADFDQRLRFDLETLRLLVRRPTMAALLKIILILLAVPPLSHFYGLTGMTLALGATYGLVLLPWSLTRSLRTVSYVRRHFCRNLRLPADRDLRLVA